MIDAAQANVGFTVFYQQPHMTHPEYGVIVEIISTVMVRVRFLCETTAKACHVWDLYYPPDFCSWDGVNVPGQPFSSEWP